MWEKNSNYSISKHLNSILSTLPHNYTIILYLLVNKKFSKVVANSGHILSNFPEEACCLATGNPIERTLRSEETASFHVLSEGQAYFRLRGILSVCQNKILHWFQ